MLPRYASPAPASTAFRQRHRLTISYVQHLRVRSELRCRPGRRTGQRRHCSQTRRKYNLTIRAGRATGRGASQRRTDTEPDASGRWRRCCSVIGEARALRVSWHCRCLTAANDPAESRQVHTTCGLWNECHQQVFHEGKRHPIRQDHAFNTEERRSTTTEATRL